MPDETYDEGRCQGVEPIQQDSGIRFQKVPFRARRASRAYRSASSRRRSTVWRTNSCLCGSSTGELYWITVPSAVMCHWTHHSDVSSDTLPCPLISHVEADFFIDGPIFDEAALGAEVCFGGSRASQPGS